MECKKNSAMESGAKQTDLKVALADFKEEKEIEVKAKMVKEEPSGTLFE